MSEDKRSVDERVEEIFERTGLPEDGRALWRARLSASSDRVKLVFVETFSDDVEMLLFFTDDLRKRIDAGNDPEKLKVVLDGEKEYFAGVLSTSKTE